MEQSKSKAWHRVASVKDVDLNRAFPLVIGDKELALYLVGENYYALEDVCPHAYALLSSGFIEGDLVECPLHAATFHIPTGKCLAPPADRDLASYPVKVDGGDIYIEL
jgi:3-phenylpropionate/trans-cinnamate dioxygenase ferredoxin subunit